MNLPENISYRLLEEIVLGEQHAAIPLAFSLKEFLKWPDAAIKHFLKERKKLLKAQEKRNAEFNDKKCCGGQCGGDA